LGAADAYESIAIEDVARCCDLFRGVYDRTNGYDGFVSLEVSPLLAHDTEATLDEARRLWGRVDRPNLMVKVPATRAGLPAIQHLLSEGINVNVTLLFSLSRYREVVEAHLAGLEARRRANRPVHQVASVASFFISRIDVLLDPRLEEIAKENPDQAERGLSLKGKVAIACAKQAYQIYKELYAGERWDRLKEAGAQTQRLLWASTATKNPEYSDVVYVESLIGPETVNTMPPATLDAYRDHGDPALRLEAGVQESAEVLSQLFKLGIDLDAVADQLEVEGVDKFVKPYEKLLSALVSKREAVTD
jgi:transaldolase